MALSRIDPDGTKSIHVSFDIDAIDPLEAPSTGTAGMKRENIIISEYFDIQFTINKGKIVVDNHSTPSLCITPLGTSI